MTEMVDRMMRAARLEPRLYEEVEHDTAATAQAVGVVVLASLAAGIGAGEGAVGLVLATVASLASWWIWALLTYWIGTRLLPEPQTRATHAELLRTIGFAHAPAILRVLGVLGGPVRPLVFFVTSVWMLVAVVIAVRHALDYTSTLRALGVCLIGWVVHALIFALLLALLVRP